MWVGRIFTAISFSPSSLPRQCPTRYVIRAGRLLSAEELRYLRTVKVTAAIDQYLSQKLIPINRESPPSVIFWHWADVSMYTSSCEFAHTCVFVKQSIEPFHCDPVKTQALYGTSLVPKIRDKFAEFLSKESLVHHSILNLPTCGGLRYGYLIFSHRRFSCI